jgi:probable phosphoglycerate mutase
MSTRLLLVRHGEIGANRERRWHGSTESDLTSRGHEQVRRLAAHLARAHHGVAAVHTSPLRRAQQTARPIAAAPGLAEFGIGVLENESYDDLVGPHRFLERIAEDLDWAPSGGESLGAVAARVTAAWAVIARAHPAAPVVAVSHGAAIAAGLALLLDRDPRAWTRYHQRNASVSELELAPTPRLLAFDRVDHLD